MAAAYTYRAARFGRLLALWLPFMAGNVWLTAWLLWPTHPWWCVGLIGAFGAAPGLVCLVIVADLRWGLFPLDTFYGLLVPMFCTPAYFLCNLGLLAAFA